MGTSPTALNKRGNKVHLDGYTFDSQRNAINKLSAKERNQVIHELIMG